MRALRAQARRAVSAAASLTGRRFGLLVASSVVATSAIVASALTGAGGSGAVAALLGDALGAAQPAASAPAPASGGGDSSSTGAGGDATAPAPEPASAPVDTTAPAPEPTAAPKPKPKSAPTPKQPAPEAGPVKHVFVISLTSPGYEESLGSQSQMPYLSATLRPEGELLSNYTLLASTALPNGIAAISGQPPNPATSASCPGFEEFADAKASSSGVLSGAGCVYPVETLTLADQLSLAQFTWRAYAAGMADEAGQPADCIHPDPGASSEPAQPGAYAASRNPFVYFHSLLDLGECSANDVPIEQLTKDLSKVEKTPSYSFLAPTPCESGTAGQCSAGAAEGPAAADAFLSAWASKILESPAYKEDGLLIVTFSAVNPSSPEATPSGAELRTGTLLLSPLLRPGSSDAGAYDPYSLLRSTEDLFGLDPLALGGAAKTKSFASSLTRSNGGD